MSRGCLPMGGSRDVCPGQGVCVQGRGVCPGGVCLRQGVWIWGCLFRGSVCPGGCVQGMWVREGMCVEGCPGGVSQHAMGQTAPPPWTEFLTRACENIIFPQLLLWAVKIHPTDDN